MNKVTDFSDYTKRKADEVAQECRTWLEGFAKKVALLALGGETLYPLSLQAICAGWAGYMSMDTTVDWWLRSCIPTFSKVPGPDDKSIKFVFYNYRCVETVEEKEIIFEIELFSRIRTGKVDDTDFMDLYEKTIKGLPEDGACNPITSMMCILFFAQKDMGFKYHSHTVEGQVFTLTVDALTERMVITTYTHQFVQLLAKLKQHVDQLNRVKKNDPLQVDWNAFKNLPKE